MTGVLGIDPGLDGALAVVSATGTLIAIRRMPTVKRELADGTKRRLVDGAAVVVFIKEWQPERAIIEDVNAFGMGVTSAFSFGRDLGRILGILDAAALPVRSVGPKVWKGALGLLRVKKPAESVADHKKMLKLIAVRRATAMFPGVKEMSHDGCAEAALIAAWGLIQPPDGR